MRILVLTSVYPPLGYSGHDERCRQAVRLLARRGHQIQVLTSDHRLPPMGVTGEKGVFRELHLYSETGEESLLGNSYRATYAHERFNAESMDYRVARFKPDVVYVWNMNRLSKSLLFRLQDKGVPVVYDLHADWLLPENYNQDPWYRWWHDNSSKRSLIFRLFIRGLGRARRVLGMLPIGESRELDLSGSYVVSEWLRTHLAGGGCEQAKGLPVIYPGMDTRMITPKKRYLGRKRFAWAGRLVEHKGADLATEAVGILKARGVDVSLDIFGMGEPSERKGKRERIEQAGLGDRVTMRGIRPGELAEYYNRYDALLYTHLSGEAFSMTVLEAMFSKLPCLVADVGGNKELLRQGENAILFEAGNAEALANAIEQFLERGDYGRTLAESMIERLHAEHSADTFCERVESLLAADSMKKDRS